jgi:hypothetical protein
VREGDAIEVPEAQGEGDDHRHATHGEFHPRRDRPLLCHVAWVEHRLSQLAFRQPHRQRLLSG